MRKIIFIFTALILASFSLHTVAMSSRLNDEADLLTDYEESTILDLLNEVSNDTNFDLVIVTTYNTQGKSVRDYSDEYHDYNGYNEDGILYLVDMSSREWWISTSGEAINIFSDDVLDYIGEECVWYLGNEDYYMAFNTFISLSEAYINGDYNSDFNSSENEFDFTSTLVISLVFGFIIALIYVSSLKSKLTTVGAQNYESNYAIDNSLQITASRDNFLYRQVSRVPRPKSNSSSTHRSSSGRSHGGRGGRF